MTKLSYETCKKLKEAGYPQEEAFTYWTKTRDPHTTYTWMDGDPPPPTEREVLYPVNDSDVAIPTLSELIEACGDGFELLTNDHPMDSNTWVAGRYDWYEPGWIEYATGKTPEEAVANLYLKLNA